MKTTALLLLTAIIFFSCKREVEDFKVPNLPSDYLPLQEGKYITYRLDSTIFTNLGSVTEIHSYQEKQLVDAPFTDNLNRISYRIYRFLRNADGSGPWQSAGSYYITVDSNKVEVVENNLRFLKLYFPLRTDFTWKGNQYLPSDPYGTYSYHSDISFWQYQYDNLNDTVRANGTTYTGVVAVKGIDEAYNVADTIPVTTSNKATIPANVKMAWISGAATDTVTIDAAPPTASYFVMSVYNRSNQPVVLNHILVPPYFSRDYEYTNGKWRMAGGKDTLSTDLPLISTRNLAVDKYAKGIGLIYQELVLWEQRFYSGTTNPYRVGFGVKRAILDHN